MRFFSYDYDNMYYLFFDSNSFLAMRLQLSPISPIRIFLATFCVFLAGFTVTPARSGEMALAPGDIIELVIYGREDLSGERPIDATGRLLVPLLGRIKATGTTPSELEKRIGNELSGKGLIAAPDVFIEVVKWRDVYVGGDVLKPGAYAWRPGMTVRQAITVAGGRGTLPPDEFSTFLQAYTVLERFHALKLSIGNLRARRSRLEAEIEFVEFVFGNGAKLHLEASKRLNVFGFLPPEAVSLSVADRSILASTTMPDLDIAKYRRQNMPLNGANLITFEQAVLDDSALIDIRATHETLIRNWVDISLSKMNSLRLQKASLIEKIDVLREQNALMDETISLSRIRLDGFLKLGEQGLVRAQDLQNMQTAYASVVSAQLAVIAEIADTEIAIAQQDLTISSFAPSLHLAISGEMEDVISSLSEANSRLIAAGRAARVAQSYLDIDQTVQGEPVVVYEITRNVSGTRDVIKATEAMMVLPGDTITSRSYDEF